MREHSLSRIEYGQHNETKAANEGEGDSNVEEDALCSRRVRRKSTIIAKVSLEKQTGVDEDDSDGAAGDEEWLQAISADVAQIRCSLFRPKEHT